MDIRNLFNSRVGKFYLDNFSYEPPQKEMLKAIFSEVVVIRCECLEYDHRYEYYAYSDCFDRIEVGDRIPEYNMKIFMKLVKDKVIYDVKFERKK